MNDTGNVYLLPLFLREMTFHLNFTNKSLCEAMDKRIYNELEKMHADITKKLNNVQVKKTKNKRIIYDLDMEYRKVKTGKGGKQIKSLFLLRDLLISLDHWKYLNAKDMCRLQKMLDSGELFFSYYDTGVDTRTISRVLSVDNASLKTYDKKVKFLLEIFAAKLKDQEERKFFFRLHCPDISHVRATFFTYQEQEVMFANIEDMANKILNLGELPFEVFPQELENICSRLESLHQAILLPKVEPIGKKEEEAILESELKEDSYYTDFHTTAMRFLKQGMRLKFPGMDEETFTIRDSFTVVEDAWCVFSKICQEDIAMGTRLEVLPLQELVIHSLHTHEKFHLQLCSSFKNWRQGDTL